MKNKKKVNPMIVMAIVGALLIAATAVIGLITGFFNKDDLRKMGVQIK